MNRRKAGSVLLVCEDVQCLELVATEIAATGCRVLCARNVRQAADFVRSGVARQFVLVVIGEEEVPPAELRAAMAGHLPGWRIDCEELGDATGSVSGGDRFVN